MAVAEFTLGSGQTPQRRASPCRETESRGVPARWHRARRAPPACYTQSPVPAGTQPRVQTRQGQRWTPALPAGGDPSRWRREDLSVLSVDAGCPYRVTLRESHSPRGPASPLRSQPDRPAASFSEAQSVLKGTPSPQPMSRTGVPRPAQWKTGKGQSHACPSQTHTRLVPSLVARGPCDRPVVLDAAGHAQSCLWTAARPPRTAVPPRLTGTARPWGSGKDLPCCVLCAP